jgi:hypothetical protein
MRLRQGPRTTWIGRFARGWRPDRNALRRRSDRAETAILAVLLAAFLGSAPFAALAASNWANGVSQREQQSQQATYRQVRAVLLETPLAPAAVVGYGVALLPEAAARWTAPGGQIRTGLVTVPATAKKGSTVLVWTDPSGQLVAPLPRTEIVARSALAGGTAVTILAVILTLVAVLARRTLNRRRLADWEADWLANGPRWTRRPNSDRE